MYSKTPAHRRPDQTVAVAGNGGGRLKQRWFSAVRRRMHKSPRACFVCTTTSPGRPPAAVFSAPPAAPNSAIPRWPTPAPTWRGAAGGDREPGRPDGEGAEHVHPTGAERPLTPSTVSVGPYGVQSSNVMTRAMRFSRQANQRERVFIAPQLLARKRPATDERVGLSRRSGTLPNNLLTLHESVP